MKLKRLMGEYKHSVDLKNRLFIPAKHREILGDEFIICHPPGGEPCLFGYSIETWEEIDQEARRRAPDKKAGRSIMRALYKTVTCVNVDKQGRITIPANLVEKIGLDGEACVKGVSNRIEIWDPETLAKIESAEDENEFEIDIDDLGIPF